MFRQRAKESKQKRHRELSYESLETRSLMSAAPWTPVGDVVASPTAYAQATPAAGASSPGAAWLTPAQVRHDYGFDYAPNDGAGQTIAIVVAFDDPGLRADLTKFDQQFGLAEPPSFTTIRQKGPNGDPPRFDANWAREAALDIEWAHAMAPKANIVLGEAADGTMANMMAMVDTVRSQTGVSVVSMSWAMTRTLSNGSVAPAEDSQEATKFDPILTTPAGHAPVTFVAASGDWGQGAAYPSSSPNVLAVGGTKLTQSNGIYISETAWNWSVDTNGQVWGSGGGISQFESQPTYMHDFMPSLKRTTPDVSYNADPNTPYAVFHTAEGGWVTGAGTSAGAPQWAGLIALANQARAQLNRAPLAHAQQDIYSLSADDFHDITTGTNGLATLPGYDMVTGRGTPRAESVIKDLTNAEVLRVSGPIQLPGGVLAPNVGNVAVQATGATGTTRATSAPTFESGPTSQSPQTQRSAQPGFDLLVTQARNEGEVDRLVDSLFEASGAKSAALKVAGRVPVIAPFASLKS